MRVTSVEIIESKDPVELPEPWLPAWLEPDGDPKMSFDWSMVRLHTDVGVTGIGPRVGDVREVDIVGFDPRKVKKFWTDYLSGRRSGNTAGLAGVEIALWDAFGKAVGEPIYKLLGGVRDEVPVYAATSRILEPEELAEKVVEIKNKGFNGAKLRLHRPNPKDDVEAVKRVREAVGDEFDLYVDANQNNASDNYEFWSRSTARRVARELNELDIIFFEEPRPRRDVEGLREIRNAVDISVAGGEHAETIHDYKSHLQEGSYDILQPDVWMEANMGITGLRQTAIVADFFNRDVIPHVKGDANTAIGLAATLQAAGSVVGIPMVEYPYDPPFLTPETLQPIVEEPIQINDEGKIPIPSQPGLGLKMDEEELSANGEIIWSAN